MSLAFLIPLTVGLGALSIYLRWMDEGAPIFGLAALIGLLTALVLAPWQVQALLLLLAVGLARYLLQQRSLPPGEPETAVAAATDEIAETTAETAAEPVTEPAPRASTPAQRPNEAIAPPPRPKAIYRGIEVQPPTPTERADRDRAIANAPPTQRPQLRYRGQPVDPPT